MIRNTNWKKTAVKFLAAQTISLFGSSLVQHSIIWYITLTTSSGVMMTLSTICGYVPQIAISFFAGVWLDRYDRKKMMMIADGVIALATFSIAILFLSGHQNIWFLFVVLIIRSAGTGIQNPAVNSFIPEIIPTEHLMRINGINSTLSSLMVFLSPAVGGTILTLTSIEATFFIDVITAVIGISIMFKVKAPVGSNIKKVGSHSSIEDIKAGILYIKNNKFIKQQIIYLSVVAILISPSAFLTPLLVNRAFGMEIWKLTVSQMVFSLGAILGGILIASWGGLKNHRHMIILATAFYGAMMIGMGLAPVYIVFLIFNCLIGISMPCYSAPLNVLLQENVEPAMHGRVFSMVQIANACAFPLGTCIFGPLGDIISVQTILFFTGIGVVLFAFFSFRSKS